MKLTRKSSRNDKKIVVFWLQENKKRKISVCLSVHKNKFPVCKIFISSNAYFYLLCIHTLFWKWFNSIPAYLVVLHNFWEGSMKGQKNELIVGAFSQKKIGPTNMQMLKNVWLNIHLSVCLYIIYACMLYFKKIL